MTTITERVSAFLAAAKGIPAYDVAVAFQELAPGTDWRGCNKTRMAQGYASEERFHHVDLQRLARMANARVAKAQNWREVR